MSLPITDPILIFTILMGLILILPLLSARMRVPDAVLLLLAGMVIGPHVGGLLARNSAITLFGSVGVLYIMFLAGLEVDLHRFAKVRKQSVMFGILTFLIPQVLGTMAGLLILDMSWPQALLLASMFASHTLLAYPIASRLGLTKSEPVIVTVGATLITDTLALLVLAVIADTTKGVVLDFWFWSGLLLGLGLLGSIAVWGIPLAARYFFKRTQENGTAQFLFVLGVMSAYSWLSHLARLEPIVGAFVAGVAFNRLIPQQGTLMNRLEFMGKTLFIPFFLISVGMLVNPGALVGSPESWLTVGLMVIMVVGTKYLAARGSAKLLGYSRDEGRVMFGLSVVQAAATLAAVLVGYELKIFDEKVLNGAIAMIMITGPLGSWYVDRYGKRLALAQKDAPQVREIPEQRIMVSIANPQSAPLLMDLSFCLRDEKRPGSIHPVTVVSPQKDGTEESVAQGENLLAACLSHAASAEMAVKPGVHVDMSISDGIVRAAQEYRSTLVILGWGQDKSVSAKLFGTVFEKILEDCTTRVCLARIVSPLNLTRRILLPLPPLSFQRSDFADLMREAGLLAKRIGAQVHMLVDQDSTALAAEAVNRLKSAVPAQFQTFSDWTQIRSHLLRAGNPDDLIFLPVERRKGLYWFPSLDRMPEHMAQHHPHTNLLAFYPALDRENRELPEFPPEDQGVIPVLGGVWDGGEDLEKGLKKLLVPLPGAQEPAISETAASLTESARSFPVEMAPGVVLIHAHENLVTQPTIVVALMGAPVQLPGTVQDVKRMICLISPRGIEPERHLAALADLARSFRIPDTLETLLKTDSIEAICSGLNKALVKVRTTK